MKKVEDYPILLGPKEVAEILNVSQPTVYKYFQHNVIPSVKLSGSRRVSREIFFNWLIESHNKG